MHAMAGPAARWRVGAGAALVLLAAAALYASFGDPAAMSPRRAELSAQLLEGAGALDGQAAQQALAELSQHLRRQPDDARAWVMKGRLEVQAQQYAEAAASFERALQGRAKTQADAALWAEYAEAVGLQQGGTLAGRPRELIDKALSIDPHQPLALDLSGSAAWEAGEYTLAVEHWRRLLARIPEGSPRHLQLSTAIERAAQRARFALPPPPR